MSLSVGFILGTQGWALFQGSSLRTPGFDSSDWRGHWPAQHRRSAS